MSVRASVLGLSTLLACLGPSPIRAEWIGSWSAAAATLTTPSVSGNTVRQFLRLSLGGAQIRVRFSNETGAETLQISGAHVALPGSAPGSIDPASDHALTFGGAGTVTVPPGTPILSDPVDMPVQALSRIAVTAQFVTASHVQVGHLLASETNYVAPGDHTGEAVILGATTSSSGYYVSGIDVSAPGQVGGAVGVIGDSLTDGLSSTQDRDHRWTDRLAERFVAQSGGPTRGVLNAGIVGNGVLSGQFLTIGGLSALGRLDRDVLGRAGLHWLIVFEGINDVIFAENGYPAATDIIAAYGQIIARAHARGIKVVGATLTPFAGAGPAYYSSARESVRQAVNAWIRTPGNYDAVLDFDAVLRAPGRPLALRPGYDSGDHLHPNDAGYRALGDSVPLDLFR